MKVLVRSTNSKFERHDDSVVATAPGCHGRDRVFRREEFHMVDLKQDQLDRDFLPPLLNCMGKGCTVALDHVLYVVGGGGLAAKAFLISVKPPPEKQHLFYMGGAKINLSLNNLSQNQGGETRKEEKTERWDSAPHPINNRDFPGCAPLFGKIYCFGYVRLKPEVYDPCVGEWNELPQVPPKLVNCQVSMPVLADPSNRRILVHLRRGPDLSSPAIYAFYPDGNEWECLVTPFSWPQSPDSPGVAALADDVIYFHDFGLPTLVLAYDIRTHKWLDVVWTSPLVDGNLSLGHLQFSSMFCLEDGSLCLADYGPSCKVDPPMTNIYFFTFTAKRCPKGTDAVILTVLNLNMQSFVLQSTYTVLDFVPL